MLQLLDIKNNRLFTWEEIKEKEMIFDVLFHSQFQSENEFMVLSEDDEIMLDEMV